MVTHGDVTHGDVVDVSLQQTCKPTVLTAMHGIL
jgi:hypothetical protein